MLPASGTIDLSSKACTYAIVYRLQFRSKTTWRLKLPLNQDRCTGFSACAITCGRIRDGCAPCELIGAAPTAGHWYFTESVREVNH